MSWIQVTMLTIGMAIILGTSSIRVIMWMAMRGHDAVSHMNASVICMPPIGIGITLIIKAAMM